MWRLALVCLRARLSDRQESKKGVDRRSALMRPYYYSILVDHSALGWEGNMGVSALGISMSVTSLDRTCASWVRCVELAELAF